MTSLTIRFAEPADASLIADISRKTFYDTFAAVNTPEDMHAFMSEQFSREALMKEVLNNDGIFLLAYLGEELAGYVRMREGEKHPIFMNHPSIEIARIYVDAGFIGKNVGGRLMEECIRMAKEMNRAILWLGVWEHNDRAIAFYTKWGFEKFGEHEFVLGTDIQTDWLMKKEL
ncbi:MAG: N-acetyltransferase family protein [Chitinophagaceae bacterium]